MIRLISILCLGSLLSCSGTSLKNLFGNPNDSAERNEELLKDFKIEKDVMAKFAVKKQKPVLDKDKASKKKSRIKPKKISKKKSNKRRASKKKASKVTPKKKVVTKKSPPVDVELSYPENFPDDLKDMDYESEKFWSEYKPFLIPGERAIFSIKYGIISTGNITIETLPDTVLGDEEVYHIQARVKTSDYYSYLYELDDLCDSFIKKDGFIPLKFSLIQRQSSQDVDDLQLFDLDSLSSYSFYKRVTKEKTKKEKQQNPIPHYFQDPLSIMYFIRGLPMEFGKSYSIPFANKGKIEMLIATPEKVEKISTKIGTREAYKVNITTKHKGQTIQGGKMTFWFATDETRIFLKFNAKIKIGSISGDILEYKK